MPIEGHLKKLQHIAGNLQGHIQVQNCVHAQEIYNRLL